MRNKTLNNKGVALITVVLIFLVLVILLGGVMFASINNQENAVLTKDNTSAYYTAESGLNLTVEKLDKFLVDNHYDDFLPTLYTAKMSALNAEILSYDDDSGVLSSISPQGSYSIDVTSPASNTYTLRSTGVVNGVTRIIEGTFNFENKMVKMAKAVITKSSITMASNATIEGPIASLMVNSSDVIDVHGCTIGEVYVPNINNTNVDEGESCNTVKPITSAVTFNSFTLPTYYANTDLRQVNFSNGTYTFPALDGKQGYYVSNLTSANMTFNLGTSGTSDQIYKLFVNNTTLNGVYDIGDITVTGNGKLMLFITVNASNTTQNSGNPKYQFSWDGNVNTGLSDMTKFQLIIRKGTLFPNNTNPTFTIPNNNTFVGSILADYVNIQFGNLVFKGFIGTLGKSVTTTSNATITGPMWVYAPNADVSLSSGSTVNGSIMANSVNITSGGTIKYQGFEGDLPFELNLPTFMGGELVPVGITFKFTNFREV